MAGPTGLTTERFIDKVSWRLGRYMAAYNDDVCEGDIVVPQRAQQFISKLNWCVMLYIVSVCGFLGVTVYAVRYCDGFRVCVVFYTLSRVGQNSNNCRSTLRL